MTLLMTSLCKSDELCEQSRLKSGRFNILLVMLTAQSFTPVILSVYRVTFKSRLQSLICSITAADTEDKITFWTTIPIEQTSLCTSK